MHGAQRLNYAGIATVARRALVATVVVAPPSSTGSPGLPGTRFDEAWTN